MNLFSPMNPINRKRDEVSRLNSKYIKRFNYWVENCDLLYKGGKRHFRTIKTWWRPFYWLGNRRWLRYGIDNFLAGNDWAWKGGKVHWWVRRNLTFD